MSRLNKLFGCLAMASILLFSACDGFDPDDSEEAVKVQATLLINTPTQDIVEGSYTITCQPSGKSQTIRLSDATLVPDRSKFALIDFSLKTFFGDAVTENIWSQMRMFSVTLEAEPGDTSCVISKSLSFKSGVPAEATDKYDVTLALVYSAGVHGSFDTVINQSFAGDKIASWLERKSELTNTLNF